MATSPTKRKETHMKIREITILVKGEKELRRLTRKEFMEFIDYEASEGTEIEVVKVDY